MSVHISHDIAGQIQRYIFETAISDYAAHLIHKHYVIKTYYIIRHNFYARKVTVTTHAHLLKPEIF